jgi:hypothetical protein
MPHDEEVGVTVRMRPGKEGSIVMALRKFWISVRTAAGMMRPRAAVDSPRLDADTIERYLRGAVFWLTPSSVDGYEGPGEFDFLPEEERHLLADGVEQFLGAARRVDQHGPATDEQIEAGLAGFRKVLEVVRPDKYADFDAFLIGKRIENQARDELPAWVRELVFETGYDASGAEALWIWAEVEDDAARDQSIPDNFLVIRDILGRAANQVCPERWPYVRLRTVSEQRPVARSNRR